MKAFEQFIFRLREMSIYQSLIWQISLMNTKIRFLFSAGIKGAAKGNGKEKAEQKGKWQLALKSLAEKDSESVYTTKV